MFSSLKNIVYVGLVGSQVFLCIFSYLPQIIKLLKTKSSKDIAIHTWVLLTLAFIDYGIILIMNHASISLLFLNAFELILCFLTMFLTIYYRKYNNVE